jgi:hypothetical protein
MTTPTAFEDVAAVAEELAQLTAAEAQTRRLRALIDRGDTLLWPVEEVSVAAHELSKTRAIYPDVLLPYALSTDIAAWLADVANELRQPGAELSNDEIDTTRPTKTTTALDCIFDAQELLFRHLHTGWTWTDEGDESEDEVGRGSQLKTVAEACEFVLATLSAAVGSVSHTYLIGRKGPATLDLIEQAVIELARTDVIQVQYLPAGGRRYRLRAEVEA